MTVPPHVFLSSAQILLNPLSIASYSRSFYLTPSVTPSFFPFFPPPSPTFPQWEGEPSPFQKFERLLSFLTCRPPFFRPPQFSHSSMLPRRAPSLSLSPPLNPLFPCFFRTRFFMSTILHIYFAPGKVLRLLPFSSFAIRHKEIVFQVFDGGIFLLRSWPFSSHSTPSPPPFLMFGQDLWKPSL